MENVKAKAPEAKVEAPEAKVEAPVENPELEPYKNVVDGLAMVGDGLVAIGEADGSQPIKLLVAQLVNKIGLNNPEVGELVTMIRFAVENDDLGLEKLTAEIAGV